METILLEDVSKVDEVVEIHLQSFEGFFLTFLGKGFLKTLYKEFINHEKSGLIVAIENNSIIGFIAYSQDMSNFYKHLIKRKIIPFVWYSFRAFLKNPNILLRLLSAFNKSEEVKRPEKYIELASIGVHPLSSSKGIGSNMISYLKSIIDFNEFEYISLETDAEDNDKVNQFYIKNGFKCRKTYKTKYGRIMNEYHYGK